MNLLVVGAGEMGRWFARTVAAGLPDPPAVAFTDADPSVAREAAASLDDGGDEPTGDPDAAGELDTEDTELNFGVQSARAVPTDTDETFDLVVIAVPIPALESAVDQYAGRADSALVDVTGVMGRAVDAMGGAAPERERVSFHPLFAASNAPGNLAVVPDNPGPVTDEIRAALAAAGNDCFETTVSEHDQAMETVQARAHAAILAFGLAAEPVREEFQTPVSAALFDVLETVAGNDPGVYADIQSAFDGAESVAEAARQIADADHEAFTALYRTASRETLDEESG